MPNKESLHAKVRLYRPELSASSIHQPSNSAQRIRTKPYVSRLACAPNALNVLRGKRIERFAGERQALDRQLHRGPFNFVSV